VRFLQNYEMKRCMNKNQYYTKRKKEKGKEEGREGGR
jgi:hypothetical protein